MGIQERKEREKEIRHQQIIVAARRVFSEKGFNKSTMENIAGEAELSQGTLYLYFQNKKELYASISLRILQYIHIRVEHVNKERDLTPVQKVEKLIEAMYDIYDFDPMFIIDMLHLQSSETLINLSPSLMIQFEELSRKSIDAISNIFQEGIGKGIFIGKHPVALSVIFWTLFSGVVLSETSKKIMHEDKNYLKKTLGIAFEIFSRGLIKDKPTVQ